MRNPELCKELLQRILPDLKIDHIEYPQLQKTMDEDKDARACLIIHSRHLQAPLCGIFGPNSVSVARYASFLGTKSPTKCDSQLAKSNFQTRSRSVRLDVYVTDNQEIVYNIEMQVSNVDHLAKRTRYYQSMIDLQLIDKGETFSELNRSYIIFICPFDLFHKKRHIYTFENTCKEDSSILLEDGAAKIFLNAKGTLDDVSKELKAFLDYVAGKKSEDTYVKKLEEAVKEAKKNREWRHEYMTLLMRDQENIEKGRKEGICAMVSALKELDISDDIILEKLQEKFNLREEEAKRYLYSVK